MSNIDTFRYYVSQLNLSKPQLEAITECCKACLEATSKDDFQPIHKDKEEPWFDMYEGDSVEDEPGDGEPSTSIDLINSAPYSWETLIDTLENLKRFGYTLNKESPTRYTMTSPSGEVSYLHITPYLHYHDSHPQFGKEEPLDTFNPDTGKFEPEMTNLGDNKDSSYYNKSPEERARIREEEREKSNLRKLHSFAWDEGRVQKWEDSTGKKVERPYDIDKVKADIGNF